MNRPHLLALVCCTIFLPLVCGGGADQTRPVTIAVNPAVTYQTIVGWEATAQAGHHDQPLFQAYKDQLFNLAVNDLGINRLRVELFSGVENPVDYFTPYITGRTDYDAYRQYKHQVINDNDDPRSINPKGFQFASLDFVIEQVVLPMQRLAKARGERIFVSICYVDSAKSEFEPIRLPEEYAEQVEATYAHLKDKYGFVPDGWELNLEPDLRGWTGEQLGAAMVAAGRRLAEKGFAPYFIGPSTTAMSNAVTFFDGMMRVPGAATYLRELSYHRYSGVSAKDLSAIAMRAAQYKLNTAMLEHIGSGYETLHEDLKAGRNSAWQQYTLAFPEGDNGAQYYVIDTRDRVAPQARLGERTKYLRQYFKYIRPGSVRIDATSQSSKVDAIAFLNPGGGAVVVAKATTGAEMRISGLPTGTYGVRYTTGDKYDVALPSQTIKTGQTLSTAIPAKGVITIYATHVGTANTKGSKPTQ